MSAAALYTDMEAEGWERMMQLLQQHGSIAASVAQFNKDKLTQRLGVWWDLPKFFGLLESDKWRQWYVHYERVHALMQGREAVKHLPQAIATRIAQEQRRFVAEGVNREVRAKEQAEATEARAQELEADAEIPADEPLFPDDDDDDST